MMPALRGLQQRDCSGVAPDSLLSLEDSEILLEERSTLSTKPPQRYNNFRIYQSADLWLLELTHYNIEWASSFRSPVRKSQIPRWIFFVFQGGVGNFFGLIIWFFRSFIWFFRRVFYFLRGNEKSLPRNLRFPPWRLILRVILVSAVVLVTWEKSCLRFILLGCERWCVVGCFLSIGVDWVLLHWSWRQLS